MNGPGLSIGPRLAHVQIRTAMFIETYATG